MRGLDQSIPELLFPSEVDPFPDRYQADCQMTRGAGRSLFLGFAEAMCDTLKSRRRLNLHVVLMALNYANATSETTDQRAGSCRPYPSQFQFGEAEEVQP